MLAPAAAGARKHQRQLRTALPDQDEVGEHARVGSLNADVDQGAIRDRVGREPRERQPPERDEALDSRSIAFRDRPSKAAPTARGSATVRSQSRATIARVLSTWATLRTWRPVRPQAVSAAPVEDEVGLLRHVAATAQAGRQVGLDPPAPPARRAEVAETQHGTSGRALVGGGEVDLLLRGQAPTPARLRSPRQDRPRRRRGLQGRLACSVHRRAGRVPLMTRTSETHARSRRPPSRAPGCRSSRRPPGRRRSPRACRSGAGSSWPRPRRRD